MASCSAMLLVERSAFGLNELLGLCARASDLRNATNDIENSA